jgi:hypothetical protein
LAGACLLGMGCSGLSGGSSSSSSSGGNGSGSSSSSGGATASDYYKQWWAAFCAHEERCANTRGRNFSSQGACDAWLDSINLAYSTFLGMTLYDYFDAHYDPDATKGAACVADLGTRACTDNGKNPDCEDARSPKSPRQSGQSCDETVDVSLFCANGLSCNAKADTNGTCNVCEAETADGQACTDSYTCESGYCLEGGTCGDPTYKDKNQSCNADDDRCVGNLKCASSSNVCSERGAVGVQCGGSRPSCYDDLECQTSGGADGICTARLADGQICKRVRGTDLPCQNACVFATKDATTGTCQTPATLPGSGQPCADVLGWGSLACDSAVTAHTTAVLSNSAYQFTACECGGKVSSGGACVFSFECSDGLYCNVTGLSTANEVQGTCAALKANDQSCTGDEQCESDYCPETSDPAGSTCEAKPACP